MDEVWFYFVLPMLAATVVALVEWRRYREGNDHSNAIVALEWRTSNLEAIVSAPSEVIDIQPLVDRVRDLEYAAQNFDRAIKDLQE